MENAQEDTGSALRTAHSQTIPSTELASTELLGAENTRCQRSGHTVGRHCSHLNHRAKTCFPENLPVFKGSVADSMVSSHCLFSQVLLHAAFTRGSDSSQQPSPGKEHPNIGGNQHLLDSYNDYLEKQMWGRSASRRTVLTPCLGPQRVEPQATGRKKLELALATAGLLPHKSCFCARTLFPTGENIRGTGQHSHQD